LKVARGNFGALSEYYGECKREFLDIVYVLLGEQNQGEYYRKERLQIVFRFRDGFHQIADAVGLVQIISCLFVCQFFDSRRSISFVVCAEYSSETMGGIDEYFAWPIKASAGGMIKGLSGSQSCAMASSCRGIEY